MLSAVSMQIQTIQATLKSRKPSCELLERTVGQLLLVTDCIKNVFIYLFMNLLC